jgi:quercetin dioxygenase-like cupin family protein
MRTTRIVNKPSPFCFRLLPGLAALLLGLQTANAQLHQAHDNPGGKPVDFPDYKNVLTAALADSGLVNKEIKFVQLTLGPGVADTIAHRHPCEVFLYVQEGTLEYREGNKTPVVYQQGEVLHEIPYSLHTLHKNPSPTAPTKLLLVAIYTKGKPTYVRECPEKTLPAKR